MTRRIAIADHAAASSISSPADWVQLTTDRHWTIWATDAPHAPVPDGTREVAREELLPVSPAELDRLRGTPAFVGTDPTEDDVRALRGDPSHDWYLWVAPLAQLEAGVAGQTYVDAVTSVDSTLTDICIRRIDGRYYAWVGLGSHMIGVIDPPTNSAAFRAEDTAEAAALAIILERRDAWRAKVRHILAGWAPEALERIERGDVPTVLGCWAYRPVRVRLIDGTGGDFWLTPSRPSRVSPAPATTTSERIYYHGRRWTRPQLRRRWRWLCRKATTAATEDRRAYYARAAHEAATILETT